MGLGPVEGEAQEGILLPELFKLGSVLVSRLNLKAQGLQKTLRSFQSPFEQARKAEIGIQDPGLNAPDRVVFLLNLVEEVQERQAGNFCLEALWSNSHLFALLLRK